MNKISVDTDTIAHPAVGGLGICSITVPDDKVFAYMEAFAMLGMTPTHEVV